MEIAGIKNNSCVNSYYLNKADKTNKEVGKDGIQQEQSDEKEEMTQPLMTQSTYRNAIMVNGLSVNVDPTGEIAWKAFWKEKSRQLNEAACKVQSYYAEAHKENRTEAERQMAFEQEKAILNGKGFVNLSDSYAWASSGGVPDREKQLEDAVQAALAKRRREMLEEVGGESTYEEYFDKIMEKFTAYHIDIEQSEKMGQIDFQA